MTKRAVWVGIDPGKDGAIAYIDKDGTFISVRDMPDLQELSGWLFMSNPNKFVALEAQQAMPKQGVSSTFTTGQGFGRLEGLLVGLQIPYEVVRPQRWMRAMGIPAGADKAKHVEVARAMYPMAELAGPRGRKLDGRADALLIATWAMREVGKR